jgi:hypothetical protein
VTVETPPIEPRPLNPLAALTLILVFPGRTFRRLVERPHWVLPLVFVVAAVMVNRLLVISSGLMDDMLRNEVFLSGAGLADARSAALVFGVVSSVVAVPVVTLLQALFFKIAGGVFGGRARFRVVFSAVCHASIPVGLSALALAALLPLTHSATAAPNLAFAVDPGRHPFLWCLAMELDLSAVWFYVLLGIGAEPVFRLPRTRARLATLAFAVVYVVVMSWTGRGGAAGRVDPYEGWLTETVPGAVLHFGEGVSPERRRSAAEACRQVAGRIGFLTGLEADRRIECYLYPSLDEKRRVTDNSKAVHRVEWANALHVALEDGTAAEMAREAFKLVDAGAHGKVYNPLIRDGMAVYCGATWAGVPVRDAGSDLLARKLLPGLDLLADPVGFGRLDERIAQPAAGSFVAFLVDSVGIDNTRALYLDSAGQSEGIDLSLEFLLGEDLGSIEERWKAYLESGLAVPDAAAGGDAPVKQ